MIAEEPSSSTPADAVRRPKIYRSQVPEISTGERVARVIVEAYPRLTMGARVQPLETDEVRSALMSRVRQRGTKPELVVRALLTDLGVRYRLNTNTLPGSPDISNKRAKKAIYVHGCFWHRHAGCRRTITPKRNRVFWLEKFKRNEQRDAEKSAALVALGFDLLVVWECESERLPALRARLDRFWHSASNR